MLVACWSPKGGSGTTVVAVLLALCARSSRDGALLVDVAGDVPAVIGVPDPAGPGLGEWLGAAPEVGLDALGRLEVDAGPGLRLVARGASVTGSTVGLRAESLAALLSRDSRLVVADCGRADRAPGRELAAGATVSLLVLRPCYLALRRALDAPLHPSGVVLVSEPGRALQRRDIEEVLGVPVWAELPLEAAVARAVDAGLLEARVPRSVHRPLAEALATVAG